MTQKSIKYHCENITGKCRKEDLRHIPKICGIHGLSMVFTIFTRGILKISFRAKEFIISHLTSTVATWV